MASFRCLTLALFLVLTTAEDASASPWIGTIDPQLHGDLQILSEWGYIDVALTSFPVPWKGISEQLDKLSESELPPVAVVSLQRLKHYLRQIRGKQQHSYVRLYGATDTNGFTTLDGAEGSDAILSLNTEVFYGRWAGNLAVNYLSGGEKNLDNSFIAYQFGDWNLRLGAIDQWWGPANSSSLILSNNARPIPAVALSRAEADSSKNSWLSFLGPWYFTTQLGQLESNRYISDAKLSMTRFNFRPIDELEIGASWLTMWGGEQLGNSVEDFWHAVTLKAECLDSQPSCSNPDKVTKANSLASLDVKYTMKMFSVPFSIYGQLVAESRDSEYASLYGFSTYFKSYRIYFEKSDTEVACSRNRAGQQNCIYEDDIYQSGFRFHERAIGSTFDSDAKSLSVGLNKHYADGDVVDVVLRQIELNSDGISPPPLQGQSEKVRQLSAFYQTNLRNFQLKVGSQFERSRLDNASWTTNTLIYADLKYVFD